MQVGAIEKAMEKVSIEPFTLSLSGLGNFRRRGRDLYWIGVDKCTELTSLYKQLSKELTAFGFEIETREYKPHLTIGREIVMERNFDKEVFSEGLLPISMEVSKISLMKSERINGILKYVEVSSKEL